MPSLNRVGVSRKIEDHDARRRLREIMTDAEPAQGASGSSSAPPPSTATRRNSATTSPTCSGSGRSSSSGIKRVPAPVEIYRESDMITRTIRDIFTTDIDTIWVDEPTAFAHASEFLQIVMPKFASRIRYFERHGAAVPQVRHRGRDRQDPPEADRDAAGRLDRSSSRPRRSSPST